MRLLVLATTRDGDAAPALAELLARKRHDPTFGRIPLTGLDTAETAALVAASTEVGATESVVRRLQAGTEGNPFFLTATLRSLTDAVPAGAAAGVLERALKDIAVPDGVREMIGRRLAGLSDTANRVLGIASAIGLEFRLEVVEGLIDASEEQVLSAVEEAVAAGLLREVEEDVDRFRFAHALVREAIYENLGATRRTRMHRRIANVLEAFGAPPAELAHHYFEGRHDQAKAIAYAEQAAEQAAAALAYEEAAGYYRRALEAGVDDAAARCALLLALGHVEVRSRRPGRARDLARGGRHRAQRRAARTPGAGRARVRAALCPSRDARPRGSRAPRRGAGRARR